MALLRSPDGGWSGEVVRPEDVVNLKCRGYVEVEPEVEPDVEPAAEPAGEVVNAVENFDVVKVDTEPVKVKGKSTEA